MKYTSARNQRGYRSLKNLPVTTSALLLSLGAASALAQSTAADSDNDKDKIVEEVVITGTLIRGIKPTGSLTVGIETEAIKISGAKTANDIIGTLPQADNLFNGRTSLDPRATSQVTVTRPNLRGLPGFTQASGAATLVLIDGHRIVGMGVNQSSPDLDIVPPSVIERMEVITDGGSALYGADAVGGVVNVITKKDFDGLEISAGYNTGDDYSSYETDVTAGTSWDGGSAYISLSYSERDSILVRDRDWAREGVWTDNGLVANSIECLSPVGTVQTWVATDFGGLIAPATVWAAAGPEQSIGERCDTTGARSLVPAEDRGSIFFGLSQDLSDTLVLDVKAYYSERNTTFEGFDRGDTVSYGPSQFEQTGPVGAWLPNGSTTEGGSVGFSYGAHPNYAHRNSESTLETWGITPELTVSLANGWQLRNTLHYSFSDSLLVEPGSDSELLNTAIDAGQVDPANIAAMDPVLLATILNDEFDGQQEQEMLLARMVADGPVFSLPAGELRTALGFEYVEQENKLRKAVVGQGEFGAEPFTEEDREVKSVFAEINVPLLSGMPGIESLVFSASVRYDDYSDFGDTTNPLIGLSWQPVEWTTIHAKWGESFVAPTLTDKLNANGSLALNPGALPSFVAAGADRAGVVVEPGREGVVFLNGAQGELDPQTSESWALGVEMFPPAVEGLYLTANYYEIDFFDLLGSIDPQSDTAPVIYPGRYLWNPTQQELENLASFAANGNETLASVPDLNNVALGLDLRVGNTDEAYLKGIDLGAGYQHETRLGTMTYSTMITHKTEFEVVSGGSTVDELEFDSSDTLVTASVGLRRDNGFQANLTWKYSNGYDTEQGEQGQTSVDGFQVFDLFLGYEFQGGGLTEGLSLRFNVKNLLDEEPSIFRRNDQPSYSGFTLGRVFGLGFTKTFH